jgi:LmbE family N-acetylglucosaminyl deacetylase
MEETIDQVRRVLFVVAHQDDEVFIVSRIWHHLQVGDQVFIIWTAASCQKGQDYQQERLLESRTLMKKLGIPESNFAFLNYPDGETYLHLGAIAHDLKVRIQTIDPQVVYVSAYEGGHIDHDIAHYCTVEALRQLGRSPEVYEFPEYSAYGTWGILPFRMRNYPDSLATQRRVLSNEEYQFVLGCWAIFKSQQFPMNPLMRVAGGWRKTFGVEYLRKLPQYNYLEPPPTQKIAYERFLKANYATFRQSVIGFQAR